MKVSILAAAALVLAGPVTTAHSQALATLNSGGNILNMQSTSGRSAPGLQFIGGYGNLDFSQGSDISYFLEMGDPTSIGGAMSAFEVMGISLSGTTGTTVVEKYQADSYGEIKRYAATWNGPAASSVTLSSGGANAGQIQALSLGGGLSMGATFRRGIVTGGSVQMNNIRVDLTTGQVIADLTGTRFAIGSGQTARPAQDFSRPNTVVWTSSALKGVPAQIPPDALLAANPITALESAGLTVIGPRTVTTYQPNTCYLPSGYGYYNSYSCPVAVTSPGITAVRADMQFNDLELTAEGAAFLTDSFGLLAPSKMALSYLNSAENPGKWGSLKVGAFSVQKTRQACSPLFPPLFQSPLPMPSWA